MKLDLHNYEMLNFLIDNFVVSKRGPTEPSSSCLLSALDELYECSLISRAEYDELLSDYQKRGYV
jgi:hypothetical protein